MTCRSVIGFRRTTMVTYPGEKILALDVILDHYAGGGEGRSYSERPGLLAQTAVIRMAIDRMTRKRSE